MTKIPYTTVGIALRQIRLDRGMRLAEMARAYGCTSSFLSQLELGRKAPPVGFVERLARACDFSPAERLHCEQAMDALVSPVVVDPETEIQAEVARAFAEGLTYLDDKDLKAIKEMIKVRSREMADAADKRLSASKRRSSDAA